MTEVKQNTGNSDAEALMTIGDAYYRGLGVPVNYKEAFRFYRKAAEMGNAGALTRMGICYEKGQGIEQDSNEALSCYEDAAEAGDIEATYRIGDYYWDGVKGLMQPDRSYASAFYMDALCMTELQESSWEVPQVYYRVARCIKNGIGAPRDLSTALLLFREAADGFYDRAVGGDAESEALLDLMENEISSCEQLMKNE